MSDEPVTVYDVGLLPPAGDTFAAVVRAQVAKSVSLARSVFAAWLDDCPPFAQTDAMTALRREAMWCAQVAASYRGGDDPQRARMHASMTAAADLLRTTAAVLERMDSTRRKVRADDLAELIFLGARLAQKDLIVRGHIDGDWADIERARQAREGRRQGQRKATARRVAWHAPALEIALAICAARPPIPAAQLGEQVHNRLEADSPIKSPSTAAVVEFVRACRADGRLPPKAAAPR